MVIEDAATQQVQILIEWMESKDSGYINPQVQIRRWDPTDANSYFGAFANAPIRKDELLIKIPREITIQLPTEAQNWTYQDTVCDLAWTFKHEFELGDESAYAPYINYLKSQPKRQLPAVWTPAGQHLLTQVQGDLNMNGVGSYTDGKEIASWIWEWFEDDCMNSKDDAAGDNATASESLNPYFLALATQRGYDYAMLPIYDMLNHHNGKNKINTITRPSIFHSDGFGVYALRDLQAGEELFYSYHGCPDCGDSLSYWGTPEMLRDFGFVEGYPQRFHLKDGYTIFMDQDENTGTYTASCSDDECPPKEFAKHQVERLEAVYKQDVLLSKDFIEASEYNVILQYHKALTVAFTTVLDLCPEGEDIVSVKPDDIIESYDDAKVSDDDDDAEEKAEDEDDDNDNGTDKDEL